MKRLIGSLKTTLVGGLLVVLPVWLALLLLVKAVRTLKVILRPISRLLPDRLIFEDLLALLLLLAVCFFAGLLMRTRLLKGIGGWLGEHVFEHIPGYKLVRGMTRQFAGEKEEGSFKPALVEIEESLVPAFIVERHPDGKFTVFVSSSPSPLAGSIYIMAPERVHPVDISLSKAMVCITKWGAGAGEMLSAMRPK